MTSETNQVYTVYTDGGARGNPGPAAFAYIIYNEAGELVKKRAHYLGSTTNNQAEYQGIVMALEALGQLSLKLPVVCKMDSQLVIRQINKAYRIKNNGLKPYLARIHGLINELGVPITFIEIPREANKEADRLVNEVLDSI